VFWDSVECKGRFLEDDGVTTIQLSTEYRLMPIHPTIPVLVAGFATLFIVGVAQQPSLSNAFVGAAGVILMALPLIRILQVGTLLTSQIKSVLEDTSRQERAAD
jgi:hypothetical protein